MGRQEKGGKSYWGGMGLSNRNGMSLSEITQTEFKIPSQLIILFLSVSPPTNKRCVFPLSIQSSSHLSIGMIYADNLGSAVRMFLSSSVL
jgi:hypothetical protein